MSTAMRQSVHERRDGVRLLRPGSDIPYRDGAEERLLELVRSASDVSSESSELLEAARGWAEQYHTHPSRANVVRALEIPPDAVVLEIGAGCGPITRYLGETGALVDSVEPVLPRAAVGRERTRDLPNVEVFCGGLDDVPAEPVYDIVVVVGVLEYVGNGSRDREIYLDFLRSCRSRIRPGGSLVLAIENKLGVKYLTGTGEDHSGRLFDSIEDYPRGSPARTFSATALLDLVATSGFMPHLFGVFPDYKHTRVVFDTGELQLRAPDLLENLPTFPSRFAGTRTLKLASEHRVWRQLVRDEVAAHFANSFLVIGSTDTSSSLWPDGRLAKYFSINRRREYSTETSVLADADGIRFQRRFSPEPGPLLAQRMTEWDYVNGRSFLDVFYASDEAGRRDLLRRWVALVHEVSADELVSLDAIPTNLIVSSDGELTLIDDEFHDAVPADRAVLRGLFWLGVHITRDTPPEAWEPARTVGEVVTQFAGLAGVQIDADAYQRLCADEAAFQVAVSTHYLGPDATANATTAIQRMWDARLWDMPLGRRLHHDYDDGVKSNENLREHYDAAIAQRDRLRAERDKAVAQRDRARQQKAEAVAERRRLRENVDSAQQELKALRRQLKAARAKENRAARKLAELQASRSHRAAESLRRGVRRLRASVDARR